MKGLGLYTPEQTAADYPLLRTGDSAARKRIIESHIRFAITIAKEQSQGSNRGELVSEALLKLVQGVDRIAKGAIDHHKIPNVTNYLGKYIKLAVKRFRRKDKLFYVDPKTYHKNPDRHIPMLLSETQGAKSSNMNNDDRGITEGRVRSDVTDRIEYEETLKLASVDERELQIVQYRIEGRTDEEIGSLLGGLTKMRVGQIRKGLVNRVRERYEHDGLGDFVRPFERQPAKSRRLPLNTRRRTNPDGATVEDRRGPDDLHTLQHPHEGGLQTRVVLPEHERATEGDGLQSNLSTQSSE